MSGHRYEIEGPGWRYGRISGMVLPNFSAGDDEMRIFSLELKTQSTGRWYWRAPTNFIYDRIDLDLGCESGGNLKHDHLSVVLPALAYRSGSTTGILDAAALRRFLVAPNAPNDFRPTATDCEWIIEILKRASKASFPRPRHHAIGFEEFTDSGLRPPNMFNVSFHHFNLGMSFPWPFWTWLFLWSALVSITWRKWVKSRHGVEPDTGSTFQKL